MEYSKLGKSDINISEIAFGCMSLEENYSTSVRLIRSAFDEGINFFDTADLYQKGVNEEMVGKALKPIRDQVIISTKVGNQWNEDGSGWNWNPTKDYILEQVNVSLKRLQTDYIDLYMLHGGTIDDPTDESIEAFEQLVDEGKIRTYGISSIRPNVIRRWTERSGISAVMMQYSLLDRRPEEEMLSLLRDNQISVLTRGSLSKGLLIDKPPKEYLKYSADTIKSLQLALNELKAHNAGLAIRYVLRNPAVSASVTGFRTMEQLSDVIEAYHNTSMSDELYNQLRDFFPVLEYTSHR